MTISDAQDAAEIHCEALSGDFLPSLGKSFLTTLYRSIIVTNVGFGIVYEKSGRVIGVAVATENTRLFFRRLLLKRFWVLIPKITLSLFRHPSVISPILETLFFSKQQGQGSNPEAELLVVVLHKTYRRQRIGREIIRSINEEFSQRGVQKYIVKTYADNIASNNFYSTNGFELLSSFILYNRQWNSYIYRVNSFGL
ncbi:MAG: GNAT family N-acetyltransferase [Planctomycetota bacterium]